MPSTSTSSHPNPPPHPKSRSKSKLLHHTYKILALAIRARTSSPKFSQDNEVALDLLREARDLTEDFLEEAEGELRRYGLLDNFRGVAGGGRGRGKGTGLMGLVCRIAVLKFASRGRGGREGGREVGFGMKVLREVVVYLDGCLGEVEEEIELLEEVVGRRRRRGGLRGGGDGLEEGKERRLRHYRREKMGERGGGRARRDEVRGREMRGGGDSQMDGETRRLSHYRREKMGERDGALPDQRVPQNGQRHGDRGQPSASDIPIHMGAERYVTTERSRTREARVRSVWGNLCSGSENAHGVGSREGSFSTPDTRRESRRLEIAAPYHASGTESMPRSPTNASNSENSRQTRAPTMNSTHSKAMTVERWLDSTSAPPSSYRSGSTSSSFHRFSHSDDGCKGSRDTRIPLPSGLSCHVDDSTVSKGSKCGIESSDRGPGVGF